MIEREADQSRGERKSSRPLTPEVIEAPLLFSESSAMCWGGRRSTINASPLVSRRRRGAAGFVESMTRLTNSSWKLSKSPDLRTFAKKDTALSF
jgi:hypothetical protein